MTALRNYCKNFLEFKEHGHFSGYENVGSLRTSAVLSFSIRAPKNVHILFCKNKFYQENLCYWVIIGGWENTKSVIRKCPKGLHFLLENKPWPDSPCADQLSHINVRHTNFFIIKITLV